MTSDPDFMKYTLGMRLKSTRSDWCEAIWLDTWHEQLLCNRDDLTHSKLQFRWLVGWVASSSALPYNVFHELMTIMIEHFGKAVADLGVRIKETILGVMSLIDIYVFEDESLDSGLIAQYFTLDVICDVALGRLLCNLASHLDVPEYFHTTE
ncbi:hypothetical protein CGCSCA5_v015015 [Colletotrichum siamense]|nr:hypothetical protein CGCSCA5_v015015 [Colletotrichum siamense]KAF4860591.1 hypothetical protein CGCSCA1_v015069 [Colletotrichum siamense]